MSAPIDRAVVSLWRAMAMWSDGRREDDALLMVLADHPAVREYMRENQRRLSESLSALEARKAREFPAPTTDDHDRVIGVEEGSTKQKRGSLT